MNAPDTHISLAVGGAEVRVPREAAVMAYLEQELAQRRPVNFPLTERATRYAFAQDLLPAIGDPFSNEKLEEIYAGLTLHGNEVFALVLLPGDFEGNWQAAGEWAEKQGGVLPSRADMLVLWQNLKGHFKKEYYWTGEQTAGGADWAWSQYFNLGYQYYGGKVYELRARAVRRVPL